MLFVPIAILAVAGVCLMSSCQSRRLAGSYQHPFIAKNPSALILNANGTYQWGALYSETKTKEVGRWWCVKDKVVVLLPDDKGKNQWFARVDKDDVLTPLRFSDNMREVMKDDPQPSSGGATAPQK